MALAVALAVTLAATLAVTLALAVALTATLSVVAFAVTLTAAFAVPVITVIAFTAVLAAVALAAKAMDRARSDPLLQLLEAQLAGIHVFILLLIDMCADSARTRPASIARHSRGATASRHAMRYKLSQFRLRSI